MVSRAIGVWPRVGGADQGAAKPIPPPHSTAVPAGGKGVKAGPTPPGPNPAPAAKGGSGKGAGLPARPPWADLCDGDSDDDACDEDGYGSEPEDAPTRQQDDDMGDIDLDDWPNDDFNELDQAADGDEMEQEPELEVLRQRWQNKKDVFEAVAWRFWKGQPQYEDAKSEKDKAYLKWQTARKEQAVPKLANLHQRRQRALDRARARLEKTKQEADEAVRLHEEDMQRRMEQIRTEQMRIDEAEENLRKVMLQVAARTDVAAQGQDAPAPNHDEVRNQAAGAKKGLQAAQTQLQELYDQLEEQGNFVACDQINVLYGALAGAAGGIDGVEQLLTKAGQARRKPVAQFFNIDTTAGDDKGGGGAPPTTKPEAASTAGRTSPGPNGDGAAGSGPTAATTDAAPTRHQPPPRSSNARLDAAAATATGATGGSATDGDGSRVLRYGGATSDEHEQQLLQAEAENALEQARVKFQEAEKGSDTDNAALLFAHQQVLARIGVPNTLEERAAFERWRKALGQCLERTAAERQQNAGAYW